MLEVLEREQAEKLPPASALACGRPRDPNRFEYVLYLNSLDLRAGEERMIEHALALTNGNRTKAARLLGLNVRSLRRKLNSKRTTPQTAPRDDRQLSLV